MSPLEEAIEKNPHDAAAFLVYADALIAAGDSHGELIHLQHQLMQRPDDEELQRRERIVRRSLAPSAFHRGVRWELGFPRELLIDFEVSIAPIVEAARLPLARFIETVRIVFHVSPEYPWRLLGELLIALPALRTLSCVLPSEFAELPRAFARFTNSTATRLSQIFERLPPLTKLRALHLGAPDLDFIEVAAIAGIRHRLGPQCELVLEGASLSFATERQLSASWPTRVVGYRTPVLLVEDPPQHAGKVLQLDDEKMAIRIGHHPDCELSLPASGLFPIHAVAHGRLIRAVTLPGTAFLAGRVLGEEDRAMKHGDLLMLGQAALRFLDHDVEAERERLKSRR